MGLYVKETSELLTANGTSTGFATVASNAAYKVGATVWLTGTALANLECRVTELSGTTLVGVRAKQFQPAYPDREIPGYGRTDISAYTTAAAARINQEAGVVPRDVTV